MLRVISTSDLSLEDLRDLSKELGPDFEMDVDERQRFYRSYVPPSWIKFLAEADWWTNLLGLYVGLYIAEIVKEAGKDTWKNRAKIPPLAVAAGGRIKQFALGLRRLRSRLAPRTRIDIGLPFPDDYDGTCLELAGTDDDELALQIALFVYFLPDVANLIRDEGLTRSSVATGLQLRLRVLGLSLEVSWQDEALRKQVRLLKFVSP